MVKLFKNDFELVDVEGHQTLKGMAVTTGIFFVIFFIFMQKILHLSNFSYLTTIKDILKMFRFKCYF